MKWAQFVQPVIIFWASSGLAQSTTQFFNCASIGQIEVEANNFQRHKRDSCDFQNNLISDNSNYFDIQQ